MLSSWIEQRGPSGQIFYGYKGRGNWHTLKIPSHTRDSVIKWIRRTMPLEIEDVIGTDSKMFKTAKILLSRKRTETRVFYRILVYWHRNFMCIDMNQFTWYVSYNYKFDDCKKCRYTWGLAGFYNYNMMNGLDDSYYKCDDHTRQRSRRGDFDRSREYNKIHNDCKRYLDGVKNSIPIRRKIPTFNDIGFKKLETYFLIKYIRTVYLKKYGKSFYGNMIKLKNIPKKVSYSDELVFFYIAMQPLEIIRMILNRV